MLDVVKISDKVIKLSFYSLFFLVPLILTPWNYELFEFNKMLVTYLMTILIVASWLIKMVALRKFILKRSFWDIPLVIFFVSQFASFVFSIDHHTSAWGYYSRFNGGLISLIAYTLLYWAFVSNMNKKSTLTAIKIILVSGLLVSLYGILEHFGVDAQYWVQDVRNRVFSTLGQPNWLAAWLIALTPLTWAFSLSNSTLNSQLACLPARQVTDKPKQRLSLLPSDFTQGKRVIGYGLFLIFYLCLLYTRSRSAIAAFVITFVVYWALVFLTSQKNRKSTFAHFLIAISLMIATGAFVGTPFTPSVSQLLKTHNSQPVTEQTAATDQPLLISESGDIRKVVWKGAVDIWKHYPLLGTGPETFAYSYYWYRPREHNDLSEWDFLYNKAHNEYLNYAATTGTIGLVAYLVLIAVFLLRQIKNLNKFGLLGIAFFSGFTGILITNFFGFSVVPISVLFFLYPAIAAAVLTPEERNKETVTLKMSGTQYGLILMILIFAVYCLISTGRYWEADTKYSYGEKINKAGQYDLAFNALQAAISLKPNEPVYHDELSLAASSLAILSYKQKDATLSSELQNLAISESNAAIKISPYNLSFWKNRTKVFYKLAEIDSKFYQSALDSLLQASKLAPTEPKIKYNLGLIYATLGQNNTAISALEETITLKPNYEDGRYALAVFYEQTGQKSKAKEQLEYILKNINPVSERAKEKLKSLQQ